MGGFLQLLGLICHEAENAAEPEVQGLYERIVANKLLALLASNVLRVIPRSDQGGGFEAVRQFIEEHLADDISIEQLMAIARVSERSLYTLFERQVGLSPRDYMRQRKLERVHAMLQLATARSVTEVALDHGFVHLGRFSEAYRKRFGELPSWGGLIQEQPRAYPMISTFDRLARQLRDSVQEDPATGVFRCRRDIFTDPDLFALEMKHIFEGGWVYLAHESQ
eukprot:gene17933-21419_t